MSSSFQIPDGKKLLLVPLLWLIFFTAASGQKVGLGAFAGLNTSSHINDFKFLIEDTRYTFSSNFRLGYRGGLIYRAIIGDNTRIQAEPSLVQLGGRYDDRFTVREFEFQTESTTTLTYIQLPLLFQLTTTPPDRAEFPRPWAETTYHFTIGGYGGYLLDATFSGVNRGAPIGIDFNGKFKNDVKNRFRAYDAGAVIGGGLEYGYKTKLGMEARAMFAVLNSGNAPGLNFNPRNLAFSLNVYFIF